jgi:hypothetical protein
MRTLVMIGLSLVVASVLPAGADALPAPMVTINQRPIDANGNPIGLANVEWANSPPTPSWRLCSPDCGDIAATTQDFQPGPVAAGTIFEAEATVDGVTTTTRTPPWQGQVTNVVPPTVVGDLRIGKQISAQGGTWSGGWGDDYHDLKLYACPTATSLSCAPMQIGYESTNATTYVHPAYAGWFVRAVDRDFGADPAFADVGLFFTPGLTTTSPIAPASQTVAVSQPVGPIPPAAPSTAGATHGKLAVGDRISVSAGAWPDAPPGAAIATGLRACPTRSNTSKCVALTTFGKPATTASKTLTHHQLGWYVGSVDEHLWPNGTALVPSTVETRLPAAGPTVVYGPLSVKPIGPRHRRH